MADLTTKRKILNASIHLFNVYGMANVRLQQIANQIGISPGNLAYHFKNKEAIVEEINEELFEKVTELLSTYRIFPNLMDFDIQLSKYFHFIQKYPFYFLDLVEIGRHYPHIKEKRQAHITKMISQIRKRFDFNLNRGIICPEPKPDIFDDTSKAIWVLIAFWVPQHLYLISHNEINAIQFKKMIWNQVYPFFTEKGIAEYEQLILPILEGQSSET